MNRRLTNTFALTILILIGACTSTQQENSSLSVFNAEAAMLVRADSFELDTKYVPPPGDSLAHHTGGFAKTMCSAVFITGLDPEFAAENVGYFTGPYQYRSLVGKPVIDYDNKAVHIDLPDGTRRTAIYTGGQGCVCLPIGSEKLMFEPKNIVSSLPDASTTPWPLGNDTSGEDFPEELDKNLVDKVVNAAFSNPAGLTAAFVVTWKGQIIGERYGEGIDMNTSLESWSMGKSLTGTLMAILIQQGIYDLWQNAPVPEWEDQQSIQSTMRIGDIMRMSSGIRFRNRSDPGFDPKLGYPDHLYVYTGGMNSFAYVASLPQQWPPNTIGRYRNSDPVLTNYLVRLGIEKLGEDYHSFPTKYLFDKLGMRNMVLETDPYGNFLIQGYELGSARDWARLGNLYLQDGVWNEERILPEGYVDYAKKLAPAWVADGRPVYGGGFFWVNGKGTEPIPRDAYYMAGAGNQKTFIIPSHSLVVVRMGHYKGSAPGNEDLRNALSMLMDIIPEG